MKKILFLLVAFAALLTTGLRAQCTTDTVDVFPWENDFGTNYQCWHQFDTLSNISINFYRTSNSNTSTFDTTWFTRISRYYPDSLNACAIASQAIQLPIDSTGLQLHWRIRKYNGSGNIQYLILVSTTQRDDLSAYDTLASRTTGSSSWTNVTADLGAYAGQTVYIAFCLPCQNRGVAIDIANVAVYSTQMPILTLPYVGTAMQTGDTSSYIVTLEQGSDSALVYSWHSTLSGETRTVQAAAGSTTDTFNIVYTTAGTDTITVTATNPWGTYTRSMTEMVVSCDAINTFPWSVNFLNPQGPWNPCWQLNDWTVIQTANANIVDENGNQLTLNKCIRSNHNGQRLIITPIAVPTGDAAENLKLWVSFQGYIDILFSTNGSDADSLFADTVFHWTEDMNTWHMRTIDLQPYAGQIVYAAFVNQATGLAQISRVNYLAIAYDRMPIVAITGQTKTITDSTVAFSTVWQHGAIDSLHYLWSSTMADAGLAEWENNVTYPDSLLGTTGRITYYAPGIDTITVVAVNSYTSYTVSTTIQVFDCGPVTQLPWTETFATVTPSSPIACWYKPEGSNWVTGINSTTQYEGHRCVFSDAVSDTMDSWLVSRAIVLPEATDFDLRLDWDASISDSTFQHSYSVLITADSDYADLSSYTTLFVDTMSLAQQDSYIWSVYTRRSIDISAWGGQTVRVAFRHQPVHWTSGTKRLFLDNVTVRTSTLPVVELSAPSVVHDDEATYTAALTEGVDSNLIFTWHSTLTDTTWIDSNPNGQTSTFHLSYSVGGMDTISVVASNIYGADTATAAVEMWVCNAMSTPYFEDFETVTPTAYNAAGNLPMCWTSYYAGTNAVYAPHVIGSYPYAPISSYVQSNHALVMIAGSTDGWDSVATVETPSIDGGLNNKWISFRYLKESASHGTLRVGYISNNNFVSLVNLPPNGPGGDTVRVPLENIPNYVNRVAIRWERSGVWYGVIIDNVTVTSLDSVPTVQIEAIPTTQAGDTVLLHAQLTDGYPDSLTYSWHSTMAAAGQAALTAYGDSARIVYSAIGIDSIRVIATNAYGSDTAWHTIEVGGLPDMVISGPSAVYTDDTATFIAHLWEGSTIGLSHIWHSAMATAGHATMTTADDTMRIVYHIAGTDTVTLVATNMYGTDTVRRTVEVTGCHIACFPWTEGFENGMSDCWRLSAGTDGTLMMPSEAGSTSDWRIRGEYWYANSGSHYLLSPFVGEEDQDRDAWVVLPAFDLPTGSDLAMSFNANFMGNTLTGTNPRLTILASTTSRNLEQFTDTLYSEQINTPGDYEYVFRSVSLAEYAGQTIWLAFVHSERQVSLSIDDISIVNNSTPVASISGPTQIESSDEALFTASLLHGDTTGLTYSWHSTMADAGLATLIVNDSTATIEYHAGGSDHVSVVITNSTGSDSVAMTCNVTDCEPITELPYTVRLNSNNNITCWQKSGGWVISDYFSSGITCMTYRNWNYDPVDSWFIMREIAIPADYSNNYTLRWHMQCDHSQYQVLVSTQGRSSHSLFTDTLHFEQHDSNSWTSRSVSLDAYRGESIFIAFCNLGWYNSPTHYSDIGVLRFDTIQLLVTPDNITYRTLTVMSSDSTMGSVTGSGEYADSSWATITASANNGYHFTSWNDGDTVNPRQVFVVSDTAFTAYFAVDSLPPSPPAPDTLWRNVSVFCDSTMGSVTGSGMYSDSSWATITAVPITLPNVDYHFEFERWNDGDTTNPRQVFVVSDTAFTAYFIAVDDSTTQAITQSSIQSFTLYPNPTSETVTVVSNHHTMLTLLDVSGRKRGEWKVESGKNTIDLRNLPSGVYFVRMEDDPAVRKLIIR